MYPQQYYHLGAPGARLQQDATTPKKPYANTNNTSQQVIRTPIYQYATPDRQNPISPYRAQQTIKTVLQYLLQMEFERTNPTFQSIQRDYSPHDSKQQLCQRVLNTSTNFEFMKNELEMYRQKCFHYESRIKEIEQQLQREACKNLEMQKELKKQQENHVLNILNEKHQQEVKDIKKQLTEQAERIKHYKQIAKQKEIENKELKLTIDEYVEKSISQAKFTRYFVEEIRKQQQAFDEIRDLNDLYREENEDLKVQLLSDQVSNKKQSEQQFQHQEIDEGVLKEMVQLFLNGEDDSLIDCDIHSLKLALLLTRQFYNQQHDRQQELLSGVQSADFRKLNSNERFDLQDRMQQLYNELQLKRSLLKDQDDEALQQEIEELERELRVFQPEDDIPHRNSAISFDQNFEEL